METFKLYQIHYTFEGQREYGYFLASSIMDALTRFEFQAKELGYAPTIHGISEHESERGGAMQVHLVKAKVELPAPVAAPAPEASATPLVDDQGKVVPLRPSGDMPGMRRLTPEAEEIARDQGWLNTEM